jgi:replicative superfamily II helicase
MNQQILRAYIEAYKDNFDVVNAMELYKWKAVKQFQDHWDIAAQDFHIMLQEALSLTENLLASHNYYPREMIINAAEIQPEIIRTLFKNLFDEAEDIYQRMETFRESMNEVINENFDVNNHYQDHRAIVVYLALRYPSRYYFYKFGMF